MKSEHYHFFHRIYIFFHFFFSLFILEPKDNLYKKLMKKKKVNKNLSLIYVIEVRNVRVV